MSCPPKLGPDLSVVRGLTAGMPELDRDKDADLIEEIIWGNLHCARPPSALSGSGFLEEIGFGVVAVQTPGDHDGSAVV